jgi:hypothetical protein
MNAGKLIQYTSYSCWWSYWNSYNDFHADGEVLGKVLTNDLMIILECQNQYIYKVISKYGICYVRKDAFE